MQLPGKINHAAFILAVLCAAMIISGRQNVYADENQIPIEGAVYHVHRPDGSHKTYLDIVVGRPFSGQLPDAVDSITVTGPNGDLPIGKDDFNYNPQWRAFWIVLSGFPEIGTYTFKLTGGKSSGTAADTQSIINTIPIPDVTRFKPVKAEPDACRTPAFSWPLLHQSDHLYYQLQIRDLNHRHVYRTDYVKNMSFVRIPPDILKPGMTYQWRIRAADDSNWIRLNNRSQSKWVTFTRRAVTGPCNYQYTVPKKTDDGWEVSSIEDEGIDPETISALMDEILSTNIANIHSLLIVRNGKLVLEDYFYGYARNSIHHLASVTKSITSILIGIARDQNKIPDVDQKIYEFFPSYRDLNWDHPKNEIRLRHALSMTAGLDWNTWEYADGDPRDSTHAMARSEDWIKFVLERNAVDTPGKHYVYNNGMSILLGAILKNTTNASAEKFAGQYLFAPLGISEFSWKKRPNGTVNTAGGLQLRPRDMAKIGYMMLKEGRWQGKQIVSAAWARESTRAHVNEPILLGSGYGYQWWRGHTFIKNKKIEIYYAAGKGGQYIFNCPALDLVVVFTSKRLNNVLGEFRPQITMVKYIFPALLSLSSPRRSVKLDSKVLEAAVGDYESKRFQMQVTILRDNDHLAYKIDNEKGALFPATETQFFGTSREIGDFETNFFKDKNGEITHFMVQVGFGFWRFDKIK